MKTDNIDRAAVLVDIVAERIEEDLKLSGNPGERDSPILYLSTDERTRLARDATRYRAVAASLRAFSRWYGGDDASLRAVWPE
jgi:hypothetical protein